MNRKSTTMALTAALLTLALQMPAAKAQSVIFPQTQQAGTALLEHSGSNFVLKNQLLTATLHYKVSNFASEDAQKWTLKQAQNSLNYVSATVVK